MSERLTNALFASQVCGIAQEASSWATSILVPTDRLAREANPDSVARFTASIRERLDFLDDLARRAALSHQGEGERG